MENNSTQKIEEEIRQYKLYKIQIIEQKIRGYQDVFDKIKESVVIKFTKNATSNIIWIVLTIIAIMLFLVGVILLFPGQVISYLEDNGDLLSEIKVDSIQVFMPFFGYFIITISLFFEIIAVLLRKNVRKRNTIFDLSLLLKDVINYMKENNKEEKKKYEYFVDSIAEIENRKKES